MSVPAITLPLLADGSATGIVRVASTVGFAKGAMVYLSGGPPFPAIAQVGAIYSNTDLYLTDPAGVAFDSSLFVVSSNAYIYQPNLTVKDPINATGVYVNNSTTNDPFVSITRDGSGNLTFTDTPTGTKTLADLAAGGGGGGVPPSRTLTAGAGLTGGGDLSANRTFDVVANADGSIVVNANDIQVGVLATNTQHGNRGGGALHATATTGAAGFMSATDKAKLDATGSGTVTVDFGTPTEDTFITVTVTGQTWVTASSKIIGWPQGTTVDHTTFDAAVEGIQVYADNLVVGTGFDLYITAPNGTTGQYVIAYTGVA